MESLRAFFLTSVFALAGILRGDFMLNAAAVEKDGQAFAIIGPSASGKSTLAAILVQQGFHLLSDSLLRIAPDSQGRMTAYPQGSGVQLWPDAVKHLHLDANQGQIVRTALPLREFSLPSAGGYFPLTCIASLKEQKDVLPDFVTQPRHGHRAVKLLFHYAAGNTWLERLASRPTFLMWAARIAQQSKVEQLDIHWGWARLNQNQQDLIAWSVGQVARVKHQSRAIADKQGDK